MSVTFELVALCAGLAAAACGGAGAGADAGPPTAELGTGEVEFEPLADGAEIQIVHGPQGGYHFFGSMRVSGVEPGDPDDLQDPKNPTTEFRVFRDGTRIDVQAARFTQGLDRGPQPCIYQMIGRLVILDIQDPAELDGAQVRMEVEVDDTNGVSVSTARDLVAVSGPLSL